MCLLFSMAVAEMVEVRSVMHASKQSKKYSVKLKSGPKLGLVC